jgi:cobaltochelatase CobT
LDAVEQTQAEAIGARAMAGVAENIGAMLKGKYCCANLNDGREQEDAPLNEAVVLHVRENKTGAPTPKRLELLVQLWREFMELKAGSCFGRFLAELDN